ncbi:MAG: glycosyltransferase family 2 protein [Carnobacterium sp.]|uniref:glycosyltransferase family 2 protein n=1 Tax=Carnobacterium sp. TaxID=48221 RepID=UPI003C772F71
MVNMPFFSIVMPAYNCENTVGLTIENLKKQTFTNFELIIVNDGSKDNTKNVLEKYSDIDERISVLTIANGGPGNARNQGIKQARGKYLLLIDADDEVSIETLEIYSNYLTQNENLDLIVSSYEMKIMDKKEIIDMRLVQTPTRIIGTHQQFLKEIYPLMNKQLMYVVWNKVYRLDIVKKFSIQFPKYKSCEDRLFNISYFKHVNKCMVVKDILYHYSFDGKNSLTNQYLPNKFETFVEFYQELLDLTLINEKGSSALFLKGVMSCIIPLHSQDCPLKYREKIRIIKGIVTHPEVVKATEKSLTDTKIRFIMKTLFKTKSSFLNYYASKSMHIIRNISPATIEKFKRKF